MGGAGSRFNSRKLIINHHNPTASSAATAAAASAHHLRQVGRGQSHDMLLPPQPPPPPSLKIAPLAAATLPRNFGQNQSPNQRQRQVVQSAVIRRSRQGTSSAASTVVASTGFMQLPSPPDPPSSFALSALVTNNSVNQDSC